MVIAGQPGARDARDPPRQRPAIGCDRGEFAVDRGEMDAAQMEAGAVVAGHLRHAGEQDDRARGAATAR
jgi:hypothetical protein